MRAQVLDWSKLHRDNAFRSDGRYAAGTAAITNYDAAVPAAELRSSLAQETLAHVVAPR